MREVAVSSFFVTANHIEAGLWTVIGTGFLLHALLKRGDTISLVASGAFLLFGFSDVIETRMGAWWRPWWLLVMKGSCVLVFLVLLARHLRDRRTASAIPDTAHPRRSTHPSR
jgi:hypothetical protein